MQADEELIRELAGEDKEMQAYLRKIGTMMYDDGSYVCPECGGRLTLREITYKTVVYTCNLCRFRLEVANPQSEPGPDEED